MRSPSNRRAAPDVTDVTHQRAYARNESEKLSETGARSGVTDCHGANGTLSGHHDRREKAHIRPDP